MLGQEPDHQFLGPGTRFAAKAVAGAFDDLQLALDFRLLQRLVKNPRLLDGHRAVGAAVDGEEGWVVDGDVGDRAGGGGQFRGLGQASTEEQLDRVQRGPARGIRPGRPGGGIAPGAIITAAGIIRARSVGPK